MRSFHVLLPTPSLPLRRQRSLVISLAATAAVFGTVMVLSSSSVEEIASGQSPFTAFLRQLLFVVVGLPLMFLAARRSSAFWQRAGVWVLGAGVFLELLVLATPLGLTVQGNRNWLRVGSFTMQPSEIVKFGLVLVVAGIVQRKWSAIRTGDDVVRAAYVPIVVAVGVGIVPVLIGKDLGTSMVIAAAVFGALLFGGVRARDLAFGAVGAAAIATLLSVTRASRASRIGTWLDGCHGSDELQAACWQPVHAQWALASGGLLGRGLGDSVLKWSWLPEADNDFIYAVVGEELGLIGAVLLLGLFLVLAIALIRLVRSQHDPFARAVVGGVFIWVIGQAFINIAVVLGLFPVLGVPLPLISAGGSSMIVTLVALGAAASFSRPTEA